MDTKYFAYIVSQKLKCPNLNNFKIIYQIFMVIVKKIQKRKKERKKERKKDQLYSLNPKNIYENMLIPDGIKQKHCI